MANIQRDPICDMEVDERNAAGQSEYQGQSYYFCSQSCKDEFDENPQQYTQRGQGAGGSR